MYTYLVKNERNLIQSLESVFLGYGKGVEGYKFWGPKANKVVISKDVVFDENFMLKSTQGKE
jgi:hypothetical protein